MRNAGKILLAAGILTLIIGILTAFMVGIIKAMMLIVLSMLLNTAGVEILRRGRSKSGNKKKR